MQRESAEYSLDIVDAKVLAELGSIAKPGDFYRRVTSVPPGLVSACTIGFFSSPTPTDAVLEAHADEIEVRCAVLPDDDTPVVILVPALPRLD